MEPNTQVQDFSFFKDDFIDKILTKLLGKNKNNPFLIFGLSFLIFWLPVYLLARVDHSRGHISSMPFIHDYAAMAQYLIMIPALILTRGIIDRSWRRVHTSIFNMQLVGPSKLERFTYFNSQIKRWANWRITTLLIILIGFGGPLIQLIPILMDGANSWHGYVVAGRNLEQLTFAGGYVLFVSLPGTITLVAYWVVKYLVWVLYLYSFSRSDIELDGFHPDRMGGLHFLSRATISFAALIFTIGVVLLATIIYKINIERASIQDPDVLVVFILYMFLAPVFFTLPLTFFTRPLLNAKLEALEQLNQYDYLLKRSSNDNDQHDKMTNPENIIPLLEENAALYETFAYVQGMRVWPVDISSISRLFLSSVTPMLPLIIQLIKLPEPIQNFIDLYLN